MVDPSDDGVEDGQLAVHVQTVVAEEQHETVEGDEEEVVRVGDFDEVPQDKVYDLIAVFEQIVTLGDREQIDGVLDGDVAEELDASLVDGDDAQLLRGLDQRSDRPRGDVQLGRVDVVEQVHDGRDGEVLHVDQDHVALRIFAELVRQELAVRAQNQLVSLGSIGKINNSQLFARWR